MSSKSIPAKIGKLTDLELISASLKGREESFEALVQRYQRPIVGYVYRMLNDYDSALDVTQEVFIKVYKSLDRYSSDYKFSTWLYRIAHNAAIDHIRRHSKKEQSLETEGDEGTYQLQLESPRPTPEDDREKSEWRREIEAVVRCLPAVYRELIILRHGKDLSYGEIAEITELPLGTVKNRLFRAREMMREMFIERGLKGI
ncbi:MAG: sigma-70 family RNA polymerase sigma factor [Pyrinomonadaceae bacterium]|nr:sigma-70 family RNA polymerase sigma factor [Pyrinomonadaceae bacterium]